MIGTKAVVEFAVLADPKADVTYQRKKSDGTYEIIAELTDYGAQLSGTGSYSINATNGYLTINNVTSKDQGDYKVETLQFGNFREAIFTLNVGGKFSFDTYSPYCSLNFL